MKVLSLSLILVCLLCACQPAQTTETVIPVITSTVTRVTPTAGNIPGITDTAQPSTEYMPSAIPTLTPTLTLTPTPLPTSPPGAYHLGWVWESPDDELFLYPVANTSGEVYAVGASGKVYSISNLGETQWTYQSEGEQLYFPKLSLDEKAIYLRTSKDRLLALDDEGKELWAFEPQKKILAQHFIGPGGEIYYPPYRLDSEGQAERYPWPEYTSLIDFSPAFTSEGNLVLVSIFGNELTILSPEGKQLKTCELDRSNSSPLVGSDNSIYMSSWEGILNAIDVKCKTRWRYESGYVYDDANWGKPSPNFPLALDAQGGIYLGGQDGRVYGVDATGELLWKSAPRPEAGDITAMVPRPEGGVFALGRRGAIQAFNSNGTRIWMDEPYYGGNRFIYPYPDGLLVLQGERLMLYTSNPELAMPEPLPVSPLADSQAAEQEVVEFMLQFVVQEEIGGTVGYIETPAPEYDLPASHIIIWAEIDDTADESNPTDLDHPIKVWDYQDGLLAERTDKLEAIQEFGDAYFVEDQQQHIFAYGFYNFGILEISEDLKEASVYLGVGCGFMCGHGYNYTLQRTPSGEWQITDQEQLWQS